MPGTCNSFKHFFLQNITEIKFKYIYIYMLENQDEFALI